MDVNPQKKKIKREKPNKKWTDGEIKIILNYLQEAPEIEAPTAQIFYKKLIAACSIDTSWDLIRFKVRHLKNTFNKANDWRRSTGAGLLESDEGTCSVEAKVLRMCPHYHQLQEIFGEKRNSTAEYDVIDTGCSEVADINDLFSVCSGNADELVESNVDECSFAEYIDVDCEVVGDIACSTSNSPVHTMQSRAQSLPSSSVPQKAKDFAAKLKKFGPKSSAAYLSAFQEDRTEMMKSKIQWEKEKFEREFLFNEQKVKAETEYKNKELEFKKLKMEKEEQHKIKELEIKKLEMEKQERMSMLQMEKEERLERYALELKWKYSVNNN